MKNTIELFQLLHANEECTENFLSYKGLPLLHKAKAEHRTTNGEKWWVNHIVAQQSVYDKFKSLMHYQSLSSGVANGDLIKYYLPLCYNNVAYVV